VQRLGLGSADFNRYTDACALPHDIEIALELQTNEGETIVSFDAGRAGGRDVTATDGSVTVDASTPVGRVLKLTVADPGRELIVSQHANYTDRMLNVKCGVHVAPLSKVVWADVFTGPIWSAPRSADDVVQFTAHGKARLAMHGIRDMVIFRQGTPKTTVIKRMLNELTGEPYTKMGQVPDLPAKLSQPLTIWPTDDVWLEARRLANSISRHLTYDGKGDVIMPRINPSGEDFTFRNVKGEPSLLVKDLLIESTRRNIKNAVHVVGGPTPSSPGVHGYAFADPSNPFSAQTQGRHGAGAYHWDEAIISSVHTKRTADRIAENMLARDLLTVRGIKFESMPMYVFDELDVVALETPAVDGHTSMSQFVIPLNIEAAPTMSYGFIQRIASDRFARQR
jgi:hypothetical protein